MDFSKFRFFVMLAVADL